MEYDRKKLAEILGPEKYSFKERLKIGTTSVEKFALHISERHGPGQLVLDAGAGECRFKKYFPNRYIGVDFAAGDCRWNYSELDAVATLDELPIQNDSADVVLLLEVMEHLSEPSGCLDEIFRVMKTGGMLYVSVPMAWEEHQEPYDFYRYTSHGIQHLLNKAGFDVQYIIPEGGVFWYLTNKLKYVPYYLNPKRMSGLNKLIYTPLFQVSKLLFQFVVPLLFFKLDALDTEKSLTLRYYAAAKKKTAPVK